MWFITCVLHKCVLEKRGHRVPPSFSGMRYVEGLGGGCLGPATPHYHSVLRRQRRVETKRLLFPFIHREGVAYCVLAANGICVASPFRMLVAQGSSSKCNPVCAPVSALSHQHLLLFPSCSGDIHTVGDFSHVSPPPPRTITSARHTKCIGAFRQFRG